MDAPEIKLSRANSLLKLETSFNSRALASLKINSRTSSLEDSLGLEGSGTMPFNTVSLRYLSSQQRREIVEVSYLIKVDEVVNECKDACFLQLNTDI